MTRGAPFRGSRGVIHVSASCGSPYNSPPRRPATPAWHDPPRSPRKRRPLMTPVVTRLTRTAAVAACVLACLITRAANAADAPAAQPTQLSTKAGPVAVEHLVKLDNPWGMTFLPDGRLLITEKP